ncbi:MAG: hypothetical protein OXT09_24625 [Myxococcales bacterium]|nr:hypothetical protein [Myxococcales bacterium]
MSGPKLTDVLRACFEDERQRERIARALLARPREERGLLQDRIDFSIVRLIVEHPETDGTEQALELAATDWRDLLMAAGHEQPDAHARWAAEVVAHPPRVVILDRVLPMQLDREGWGTCPHCGYRFKLKSSSWNGTQHVRCAGRIRALHSRER